MRTRADQLLVDRGLAESRSRAQALILAGKVFSGERRIAKAGDALAPDTALEVRGQDHPWVSRGGLKLDHALRHFGLSPAGRICLDIGASTGGFTDCMLQSGAQSVLAVDTGYGQIAQKLRDDPRVTLRERTNARLLTPGELLAQANENCHPSRSGGPAFSFFAMDVSFISATLVLPAVLSALGTEGHAWQGSAVILIKPQFEAGRAHIGKGGIVRDPGARQSAIQRVRDCVLEQHGTAVDVIDSPIQGMEGNHEYLLHARFT